MSVGPVFLSPPAVVLPTTRVDNDDVLRRMREQFKGSDAAFTALERAIRFVLGRCNTQVRYIEADPTVRVADFAARAVRQCLEQNAVHPANVDLLIYGGIARDYLAPATAMEVASKCGIELVHAFDVTSACVGLLEALHVAQAYFVLHPRLRTAVICSAELSHGRLDYDLQSPSDLLRKAAGLTIGNAAAAFVVSRRQFAGGSLQLRTMTHRSLPHHWDLCKVPTQGTFDSLSLELQRLSVHVPPIVVNALDDAGWRVDDVDYYVFHQPGDAMVLDSMVGTGVDKSKIVLTHRLYGNTATTTVPLALRHLIDEQLLVDDDKLLLGSAAAGFSMVCAAAVWTA